MRATASRPSVILFLRSAVLAWKRLATRRIPFVTRTGSPEMASSESATEAPASTTSSAKSAMPSVNPVACLIWSAGPAKRVIEVQPLCYCDCLFRASTAADPRRQIN